MTKFRDGGNLTLLFTILLPSDISISYCVNSKKGMDVLPCETIVQRLFRRFGNNEVLLEPSRTIEEERKDPTCN